MKNIKNEAISLFFLITRLFVSLMLLIALLILLFFIGNEVYSLFITAMTLPSMELLHDIVFIIVLVKAYRLLVYYLKFHHVSIKYIIEISIIAPAIEVIFALHSQAISQSLLLAGFGLINLIIYLLFYDKLKAQGDRQI